MAGQVAQCKGPGTDPSTRGWGYAVLKPSLENTTFSVLLTTGVQNAMRAQSSEEIAAAKNQRSLTKELFELSLRRMTRGPPGREEVERIYRRDGVGKGLEDEFVFLGENKLSDWSRVGMSLCGVWRGSSSRIGEQRRSGAKLGLVCQATEPDLCP